MQKSLILTKQSSQGVFPLACGNLSLKGTPFIVEISPVEKEVKRLNDLIALSNKTKQNLAEMKARGNLI